VRAGLSRFDLSLWDEILAPHVVLHKDAVTLHDDLHGAGRGLPFALVAVHCITCSPARLLHVASERCNRH
jgi:hypothetical protein